jgi:hypothetical protein
VAGSSANLNMGKVNNIIILALSLGNGNINFIKAIVELLGKVGSRVIVNSRRSRSWAVTED